MSEQVKYPSYRWVVLLVAWFTFLVGVYNWNVVAARYDLMSDLGLTTSQFGTIFTGPTLACIFLCIVGGALGDRYGIRLVVSIGAVVATIGCLLRLTAGGFGTLFVYTLLLGVGLGVMFPNLPKLVGLWFPPRQVGLATGVYVTGLSLGMALGLGTGAVFPSWQSATLILGIIMAVATVLWIVLARDKPAGVPAVEAEAGTLREGLVRSLRVRDMWFIIGIEALVGVIILSYIGGLPLILTAVKGMDEAAASLVSALAVVGSIVGTVFWPILAEKVGVRKPIFITTMVATGATGILVWYLAPGPGMWALAFFPGFFIIAGLVYMLMAPVELPEIGPRYAGSAGGVVLTAFNIGAFVGLPFMYTPIWVASGANMAAWFLVILCVLTGALGIGMRELGRKAREKEVARASAEAPAS